MRHTIALLGTALMLAACAVGPSTYPSTYGRLPESSAAPMPGPATTEQAVAAAPAHPSSSQEPEPPPPTCAAAWEGAVTDVHVTDDSDAEPVITVFGLQPYSLPELAPYLDPDTCAELPAEDVRTLLEEHMCGDAETFVLGTIPGNRPPGALARIRLSYRPSVALTRQSHELLCNAEARAEVVAQRQLDALCLALGARFPMNAGPDFTFEPPSGEELGSAAECVDVNMWTGAVEMLASVAASDLEAVATVLSENEALFRFIYSRSYLVRPHAETLCQSDDPDVLGLGYQYCSRETQQDVLIRLLTSRMGEDADELILEGDTAWLVGDDAISRFTLTVSGKFADDTLNIDIGRRWTRYTSRASRSRFCGLIEDYVNARVEPGMVLTTVFNNEVEILDEADVSCARMVEGARSAEVTGMLEWDTRDIYRGTRRDLEARMTCTFDRLDVAGDTYWGLRDCDF